MTECEMPKKIRIIMANPFEWFFSKMGQEYEVLSIEQGGDGEAIYWVKHERQPAKVSAENCEPVCD